jgi:hypothetical protein
MYLKLQKNVQRSDSDIMKHFSSFLEQKGFDQVLELGQDDDAKFDFGDLESMVNNVNIPMAHQKP